MFIKEVNSMLVSTKGRYALRVMIELARSAPEEYITLVSIASEQGISEKYLESIVSKLAKAGLIEGLRGKGGGYRLTRRPSEYTMRDILSVTEDSLAPVSCLDCKPNKCERSKDCATLPVWERLDAIICEYMESVKLSDFAGGDQALTDK